MEHAADLVSIPARTSVTRKDPTGETPSILDIGLRRQRRWCSGKSPWNSRHVDVYVYVMYVVCLSYLSAGSMNLEDSWNKYKQMRFVRGISKVTVKFQPALDRWAGYGTHTMPLRHRFICFRPEPGVRKSQPEYIWIPGCGRWWSML